MSEVEETPSPRKTQKLKKKQPRKVLTPGMYKLPYIQEEEVEQETEEIPLMEREDSEEGIEREVSED